MLRDPSTFERCRGGWEDRCLWEVFTDYCPLLRTPESVLLPLPFGPGRSSGTPPSPAACARIFATRTTLRLRMLFRARRELVHRACRSLMFHVKRPDVPTRASARAPHGVEGTPPTPRSRFLCAKPGALVGRPRTWSFAVEFVRATPAARTPISVAVHSRHRSPFSHARTPPILSTRAHRCDLILARRWTS